MSESRQPIPFRGSSGQRVAAYRYPGGEPAVIIGPGIFAHQSLPEIRALAARLAGPRTVYTLDFRGHGESAGAFSLGREEHLDLAILVSQVRRDHPRVALVGFSFGGFHAVLCAAHTPVDALVLVSAPAHLRVLDHFPFGPSYFKTLPHLARRRRGLVWVNPMLWPRVTPDRVIHEITAPILIVHGTADWIVSPRHAEILHSRATAPRRLHIIDRGLHAEYLLAQDPDDLPRRIQDFLDDPPTEPPIEPPTSK